MARRDGVGPETTHTGMGPLSFDVAMAREHGWSEAAIQRTEDRICAMARKENALAHRNGPVAGCPCVTCDESVPLEELFDSYRRQRASWMRRGLWRPTPPPTKDTTRSADDE